MLSLIVNIFKNMQDLQDDEKELRAQSGKQPTKEQKLSTSERALSIKQMEEFFDSSSIQKNVDLVNQLLVIVTNTDLDFSDLVKTHVVCVFNSYFPEILKLSDSSYDQEENNRKDHKVLMAPLTDKSDK